MKVTGEECIMKKLLVCLLFLSLVVAGTSLADSITYTIGSPNAQLSAFMGPYAIVTIDLTSSTTAIVTFQAIPPFLIGDGGSTDLNVNASNFGVGSFSNTFVSPIVGSGNVSEFGFFNLTIKNFDGFNSAASSFSFVLTDLSGTWSSASDVLTLNNRG